MNLISQSSHQLIRRRITGLFFFLMITLASCVGQTPKQAIENILSINPTSVPLSQGLGGIKGSVQTPSRWKNLDLYAYASPYLGDPQGEGIFILEENLMKFAEINADGYFQIIDVSPGIYILVIGPEVNQAEAYRENQAAIKIHVLENEYFDVGVITISP